MAERVAAGLAARMREAPAPAADRRGDAEAPSADERERLLQSALRLAVLHDYRELTAPQIADDADVAIDAFLELFADKDDCFLAALDMVGDELLAIAADPELISSDWPRAVRRVIGELMRYLADRPLYAQTIAQEAFFAGAEAAERNLELAHEHRHAAHRGRAERGAERRSRSRASPARSGTPSAARWPAGASSCSPRSPTTSPMSCSRRSSAPRPRSRS